jgi:hypothetical protein
MSGGRRTSAGVLCVSACALGLTTALVPGSASGHAAAGWLPPVTISTSGGDALTGEVAVDSAGNALALWARSQGKRWVIQAVYRPLHGLWQAPRDLSAPSSLAGAPQVAFDRDGNALAVWERSDGNHLFVQASSRSRPSGRWSKPQDLSRGGGDCVFPQVAIDADGNALAVWLRSVNGFWSVQAAFRPRGSTWQPPETIDREPAGAVSPQVVFDPRGNAVAAWAALVGTKWAIMTADRLRAGGWGKPEALALAGDYPRVRLRLAVDGRGAAVVVWEGLHALHSVIQAAVRSTPRQQWSGVRDLSDDSSDAVSPQLAVDGRGDVAVVWTRTNGKNWLVQASERPAGRPWEPARTLSGAGRDAVAPGVGLDARGDAIAVWTRSNGSNTIVQASYRLQPAGMWSTPTSMSATGGDAVGPVVALDARGNATLVWSRFDGRSFAAQASGYDASGPEPRGPVTPGG